MVQTVLAGTVSELQQILALQEKNLLSNLSLDEKQEQGFLTVKHSLEQLQHMQEIAPHLLAKDGEQLAGYVLSMTMASRDLVPLLVTLFDQFDRLELAGQKVSAFNPMVVGQICVAKSHRGKGIFDSLYAGYKKAHALHYDFAITSIALSNTRSMAAHQRVGFKVLSTFEDKTQPWAIVYWDWNSMFPQRRKV